MKKLVLSLFAVGALASVAFAGTEYSGKEMKQVAPAPAPCPEWYADNEWNVSLWGAYAFTGTDNNRGSIDDVFFKTGGDYDRFLGGDHAWGGGVDGKYFFHRYFGVGIEGFGLAGRGSDYDIEDFGATTFSKGTDHHAVGGVLGTLTLRYPIPCTRFSPYVWAGGGGIFGGENDRAHFSDGVAETVREEDESRLMGQFGGGLEVRITPHIGWIADFSWNVIDGRNNNFGMARTGINFAF
jgi:opacity protein-like surface antigen